MGDCLISFIVPVYNAADYISECVESILRQTVPDFEVLIVDDGSFDGSELICDEFAEKDQRVRVIHTENCGVSHARNTGIELAKEDIWCLSMPMIWFRTDWQRKSKKNYG